MGINVYLERKTENGWEKIRHWDSLRYSGDSAITHPETGISWNMHYDEFEEATFKRPKEFSEARLWVENNLTGFAVNRWAGALDIMEQDPQVYVYISY